MSPERERRPAGNGAATISTPDAAIITAQQSNWLPVHDLVAPILESVGRWPLLGSPEWCSLAPDDPAKWAAVLDGGQHHALRLELNQRARAEASRAVAGAADWSQIANEIRRRRGSTRIPRVVAR
ncbi:DUF2742 domain-containing protein [Mycobacterium kansasii]|uniref:DUF2742 domain-containing protein n=1 Tax=Mycobacterium kansasii TaxID=1768 RepID=UPI00358DBFFA